MTTGTRGSRRRGDALSRERIVDAAVALLDGSGAEGLTFRALASRLATGAGAIYWHVANKDELLGAATDAVVADALGGDAGPSGSSGPSGPADRVRAVSLGLFDALDAHPWVAAQLSVSAYQSSTPRIFERFGREVAALGVPPERGFTATSVLVEYVLGVAAQNAAHGARARALALDDRAAYLDSVARSWAALDPDEYAFTRTVADQLRDHDDRAELLAGLDVVLAGIVAVHATG